MMTSALLATSAVIVAPFAENDVGAAAGAAAASGAVGASRCGTRSGHRRVAEERAAAPPGERSAGRRAAAAVAAGQHRAQRLRDARGLGVLEIDDEHVAAGAAGRVELLDQLAHAREPPGIVGAHQHAVRARVGHDRHALLGVGRRPVPPAPGIGQQPVQQRDDVERRRVAERHE